MKVWSRKALSLMLAATLAFSPAAGLGNHSSYAAEAASSISAQELFDAFMARLNGLDNLTKLENKAALFLLKSWLQLPTTKTAMKASVENYYEVEKALLDGQGFNKEMAKQMLEKVASSDAIFMSLISESVTLESQRSPLTILSKELYAMAPSQYKLQFESLKKENATIKSAFKAAIDEAMKNKELVLATKTVRGAETTYYVDINPAVEGILASKLFGILDIKNDADQIKAESFINTTLAIYRVIKSAFIENLNLTNINEKALFVASSLDIVKMTTIIIPEVSTDKRKIEFADSTNVVGNKKSLTLDVTEASKLEGIVNVLQKVGNEAEFKVVKGLTDKANEDAIAKAADLIGSGKKLKVGKYTLVYSIKNSDTDTQTLELELEVIDKVARAAAAEAARLAAAEEAAERRAAAAAEAARLAALNAPVIVNPEGTPLAPAKLPTTTPAETVTVDDEKTAKGAADIPQITPAEALSKMQSLGILGKTFNSKAQMNFSEVAGTFTKLLGLKVDAKSKDPKVAKTPTEALKNAGLLKGITLAKSGKMTRDQMATFMANIYAMKDKKAVNKALKFDADLKDAKLVKEEFYDALEKLYKKDSIMTNANMTGLDYLIIFFTMFLD